METIVTKLHSLVNVAKGTISCTRKFWLALEGSILVRDVTLVNLQRVVTYAIKKLKFSTFFDSMLRVLKNLLRVGSV